MTGWNEDNFLEELMPLAGRRPAADPCPQVEALRAVTDRHASENAKSAIAAHAATCPVCRSLQQRLQAFDATLFTSQEADWEQTEGRLDSWLKGFLASGGAVYKVDSRTSESRPRLWWQRPTTLPVGWQMRWVLVPAATVAVVICSFLIGRLSAPQPRQLAVVTPYNSSSPNPVPAGAVAEARIPESGPDRELLSQAAPRIRPNPARDDVAPNAPTPITPVAAAPSQHDRETNSAVLAPPAHGKSERAWAPAPPPPQAPKGTLATGSSYAQARRTAETAEASALARPNRPAGAGSTFSGQLTPAGMRSVVATRSAASLAVRAEHTPVVLAPPLIRLDAGTRVWISVKSVQPLTEGVSEFRGVVLLPVTQSSAVLLVRNTEVFGTVPVRNGKRSVQIREFLSAEAHYRLRSAGGETNLRLLGAGEVVEFDAGKVLETWMATESTYEKLPAESRPPE